MKNPILLLWDDFSRLRACWVVNLSEQRKLMPPGSPFSMEARWIREAWDSLSIEVIAKGYKKCFAICTYMFMVVRCTMYTGDRYKQRKSVCPPSPKRIPKRLQRHYERQKREMDVLTLEFSEQSEVLRLRLEERKKAIRKTKKESKPSAWETVAKHRLQLKLAAEARTDWLQKAIEGNAALIDDLTDIVRYRMKISRILAAQLPPSVFPKPSDDVLYVTDMLELGDMYQQTETIFRNCGLNPPSSETSQFQRSVITNGSAVCVQLVRRQHMLFSYEQTSRSIWMLAHMMHRQDEREDYPDIDDPDNTMVTKFRVTKHFPGGISLSLRERMVVRKFKEDNRTVLVWKALLSGEDSCAGMQTEEVGWSIIRPSSTGTEAIVEVCMQQTPLYVHAGDTATRFENLLHAILLLPLIGKDLNK